MHMILPVMGVAIMALAACGDTVQRSDAPTVLIPAGHAHWVRVDDELDAQAIVNRRIILDYGPPLSAGGLRMEVPGAPPAEGAGSEVVAYRIAAVAHITDDESRCPLAVVALVLVRRDGQTSDLPAQGYVIDNSDGRKGFRLDVSPSDQRTVVIPAHATATVVFDANVVRR
jgi:hypothetical protein